MHDLDLGAARLRETVLAAWTASPARFREDANAEEDFALGGYRDRLVVELAQNAADAALRAGVPGRLRLELRDGVLLAANVGAPLDATGVEGLCTLRVSGKRDETGAAGRFGVGFAAVVSVTDAPAIASRETGGVRWSRDETAALVAGRPELAAELADRAGHVPLLRLPFPDDSLAVPDGFDTVVRLPLRDEAAERAVRRMLEEAGPALPLAMPALKVIEIEVEGRSREISAEGWHVVAESGAFTPEQVAELFADRPTEERARPYWEVRWAVRRPDAAGGGDVPRVVHAPTPSDEPLDLPALLIATFPMTTDRRHVAPGPLADFLVKRAAEAYVRLLEELPRTPELLDLVPGMMGKGALDAAIRQEIIRLLPDTPLLPAIGEDDPVPGSQARAVLGSAEFLEKIAGIVPGLLPAGWASRHPALTTLGVRRVELADVVDMLTGDAVEDRDPAWWRSLYEVLPADDPEAIAAVAVPLADGRLVRGPRGTVMLSGASGSTVSDPAALAPLGLRIVHPEAAHPLLLRLGAAEATPRTVLDDPLTHAAVAESLHSADPEPVAQAVLALVEAAGLTAGEAPWLADLALRGADGELYAAGDLLLADGSLAGLIDPEVPFGVAAPELVARFGPNVLTAAGVLDGFAVANDTDVLLDPADCDHDLDLEDEWLEAVLDLLHDRLPDLDVPPVAPEFSAVRDLEYVADWPAALALLSRPPLRAVLRPLRVIAAGQTIEVPSYTAWWLSRHPVLDGRRPTSLRLPSGDPLLFGLYGDAPAGIDEAALELIGVRSSLDALLASHGGPDELLDLLADPSVEVDRAQLRALWIALAAVDPAGVHPPEAVRAVQKGSIVVADVDDGRGPVVVEAPDLLPLVADRPLVLAPFDLAEALSEVLDLPLVGEIVSGAVTSSGSERPVPEEVRSLLPSAPPTYVEHENLLVDGTPVPWRFFEGKVHASGVEGLARGLAWASGQWGDRLAVAALLRDPGRVPLLLAEADLDPVASL
ncbi:sacsin N-terminal ATP-binding-like domain-containing protein [Sphaerimonospora mesophila]|uniref:sacsin N-terminal ATP-binding-like domain-containing protein n=1 Tax=Sphaerimonospora mesophila TaxID=37483 RepID=UPI0006E1C5C2